MEDDVRVLLIEDDVAAAEMYRLRLVADGYSVVIARDGQEGLSMAADQAPDFIYLDHHTHSVSTRTQPTTGF